MSNRVWVIFVLGSALVLGSVGVSLGAADDLTLVSRATGLTGPKGNGTSNLPSTSSDGRYVAFTSSATNLDPDDPGTSADVYRRDVQTGDTLLISRGTGGVSNGNSGNASISGDGRYVAFQSTATNLHPDDSDATLDVYVRDTQAATTTLVSRAAGAAGVKGNGASTLASIAPGGRYVAFQSTASNLEAADPDSDADVYLRDLQTDALTLVSRATGVSGAKSDGASSTPSVSSDGHHVAFTSTGANLDPADTDSGPDIFVRDIQANSTSLVSRATGAGGAKGDDSSTLPSISGDGSYMAFTSTSTNLDPDDTSATESVFVRNLVTAATILVSRATGPAGASANNSATNASLSSDGRLVAFGSSASNLDPADPDTFTDVFVRDLPNDATILASRADGPAGNKGNSTSTSPEIAVDAPRIVFGSNASNLDPDDVDGVQDIFQREIALGALPVAVADAVTVAHGSGATTIDVLVNDTDADGGPRRIISASDPANGTVMVAADGLSLSYQPDAGYCDSGAPATFTYELNGGSQATVSVTVPCPPATARIGRCAGKTATITGTSGPDAIVGTNRADVIQAGGGDDKVTARGGRDLVCGAAGRDRLRGKGGRDVLIGGADQDVLFGGKAVDILRGGSPGGTGKATNGTDRCPNGQRDNRRGCVLE
jgi:Tol biopolymer transport system component